MEYALEELLAVDDRLLDRAIASGGLHDFIELAWHLVEPAKPFVDNWHIGAVCEHLEAAIAGEIPRLVINIPPGTMKSLSCAVFLPAWDWGPNGIPGKKYIYGSYSDRIAFRDSGRTRRLIDSDWYQNCWGDHVHMQERNASKITNIEGGFRLATTVRGGVTGEHADVQVVDDPIKPFEVSRSMHVAARALEDVIVWWDQTMATRVTDVAKAIRIIIMQRLHDNDLAGYVLKAGGYEHLMLPMEFEMSRRCFTSIGFSDPRTVEGELLFPERFPAEAIERQKKELGTRGSRAQHQQDPIAEGGNIIKGDWVRHWDPKQLPAPHRWHMLIQSWDCTFKDSDNTDFVAGQVWGASGEYYYLLDYFLERAGLMDTCTAIKKMTLRFPKARVKLIEDKANGPAVFETLDGIISGMKLVNPEGGKIARVHAVEPLWEAGRVLIPPAGHPQYPWVPSFISNVTGFPSRHHDDDVDSMSQALIYLESKAFVKLKKAMEKARC